MALDTQLSVRLTGEHDRYISQQLEQLQAQLPPAWRGKYKKADVVRALLDDAIAGGRVIQTPPVGGA